MANTGKPSSPASADPGAPKAAAELAKAAFRRLAQARLEPTPENYAKAYAEEAGSPPPRSPAVPAAGAAEAELKALGASWVAASERLLRNLERGGKQWTAARRKDSLQRVFSSSRNEPQRLLQRLQSLMSAWESDQPADPALTGIEDPPIEAHPAPQPEGHWLPLVQTLQDTLAVGLSTPEDRARSLADRLAALADAVARDGAHAQHLNDAEALCVLIRRWFGHHQHLMGSLGALCQELGLGLAELCEDDSWAQGQCQVLRVHLGLEPQSADAGRVDTVPHAGASATFTSRGVQAARTVLAETRQRQARVRAERGSARDALKQLIRSMLQEVGELGEHTGRFQASTARHAEAIAQADTLEGLAGVVHALLDDARTVQSAVNQSQQRLAADQAHAETLEARVRELEGELRRLSEEVSTDALTQVANRRGLTQAFDSEIARLERTLAEDPQAPGLAVGLIDIDNFKKLNDTLGHAAGDTALKNLAAAVRERLRPGDHLARFGGEEFVVLLPGTVLEEAQQALTRLQRSLSQALFLHDGREIFVTFSAGVTAWRPGEGLQSALERADEALYEAKRTGKNRTCMA